MINKLNKLFDSGHDSDSILEFLISQMPALASKIKKASLQGYSSEQILDYLQRFGLSRPKSKPKQYALTGDEIKDSATRSLAKAEARPKTVQEKTHDRLKGLLSGAGELAAGSLGAYAFGKLASPLVNQALSRVPQLAHLPIVQRMLGGQMANPAAQNAPQQAMNPVQETPQPIQAAPMPPPNRDADIFKNVSLIDRLGYGQSMRNFKNQNLSPDQIATALEFILRPTQKREIGKQTKSSLSEIAKDYLTFIEKEQPQEVNLANPAAEDKKIAENLQKGAIISTKQGKVGTVENIDRNMAKINIDGKETYEPIEDLEQAPEEIKNLKVEFKGELPSVTHLPSAVINGVLYNKNKKYLVVDFHKNGTYAYLDVPEDIYAKVSQGDFNCKTDGENEFGSWFVGKNPSRGAALNAYLKKLGFKHIKLM